ncbi:MAG: YggS family pyridoxal phosphate-dependent enzyme, partial [Geminicoccaceae bacterium]
MNDTVDVAANLAAVRARIVEAATDAGRDPAAVTLIAVGKAQPVERIEAALAAGQRIFGENYVQEAQGRWPALRARYPEVELHLIGALQTNKAKDAVALFDVIQTVDRPRLAAALEKEMTKQGKALRCFVQVNTGKEPQKAGIMPEETEAFVRLCRESHGLDVRGLMAIP